MVSVPSGRWWPCCSSAPAGQSATHSSACRSTSGHFISNSFIFCSFRQRRERENAKERKREPTPNHHGDTEKDTRRSSIYDGTDRTVRIRLRSTSGRPHPIL